MKVKPITSKVKKTGSTVSTQAPIYTKEKRVGAGAWIKK